MFEDVLARLGIGEVNSGVASGAWVTTPSGGEIDVHNPATGVRMARVQTASRDDYERCVARSEDTFQRWRSTPAPQRGEYVRRLGNALRGAREDLGLLVTLETGKIQSEGVGEVQEMIDMCDFATGLSRQLYGLTMASERPIIGCLNNGIH